MEDILDLYEEKYDANQPVICLDEKPVTLHAEARKSLAAKPGRPLKRDYEYVRKGSANIFCSVEPKAGRHFAKATKNRKFPEFAKMISDIARHYPRAKTIHLVLDNLSTHKEKSLLKHFGEQYGRKIWRRFTLHYTPTHGSWLNQAENEIGLFVRNYLAGVRVPDLQMLRIKAGAWNKESNKNKLTFDWRFTKKIARKTMKYKK